MSTFGTLSVKSKVRVKNQRGYDGATGYITADLGEKTVRISKYMQPVRCRYYTVQLSDKPNLPAMTFAADELEPV